ncbi:hypothetical protein Hanom_Chr16g01522031 [Helianthus anomalus]
MKGNAMDHLFTSSAAQHQDIARTSFAAPFHHIISRPRKRPPNFNHPSPKIGIQSQFPCFRRCSTHRQTVNLDFQKFPFDHFGLVFNPYTNNLPKSRGELKTN